jgi:hypothetical protein
MAANSRIAMQEEELAQTRVIKHTLDQVMGTPSEADFGGREVTEQTLSNLQTAFNAGSRPAVQRRDIWVSHLQEDARSDISDGLSASGYNQARGYWNNASQSSVRTNIPFNSDNGVSFTGTATIGAPSYHGQGNFTANPRGVEAPGSPPAYGFDSRYGTDNTSNFQVAGGRRGITQPNRGGSCFPPQNSPWGTFAPMAPGGGNVRGAGQQQFVSYSPAPMLPGQVAYQPRPIGTPLSPTAAEFTSFNASSTAWSTSVSRAP